MVGRVWEAFEPAASYERSANLRASGHPFCSGPGRSTRRRSTMTVQPEPAVLVLLDDIDRASLYLHPALSASRTLERMFDAMPPGYDFTGQEVAALLRCVNVTAGQGCPQ